LIIGIVTEHIPHALFQLRTKLDEFFEFDDHQVQTGKIRGQVSRAKILTIIHQCQLKLSNRVKRLQLSSA
jgi:hypothetical protein